MRGVRVEAALALTPGRLPPSPPTPSAGEGGRVFGSFALLFGSLELTKINTGVCSPLREGAGNTHPERGSPATNGPSGVGKPG